MLVLTRYTGKSIRIGDDIIVTILSLKDNRVRVGIHAPQEIPVHREEIYQKILTEEESSEA